jgi:hypothetical protein
MTPENRLRVIQVKIERAIKHIDELGIACTKFIDSKPYTVGRDTDPKTGYNRYYVTDLKPPPLEIGLIAGDVIHNLRSALDHLAYQLVIVNGGIPSRWTSFPIFDSAAKYKTMDTRKVSGMSQAAINAIDAAKPYQGGNEPLWIVHDLDIADKHHALLATLVSVTRCTLQLPVSPLDPRFRSPAFALPNFQEPLKDGDPFFICESGVEDYAKFSFDVALCEPEIIKGRPICPTLGQLLKHVNGTIIAFEPMLA